MTLDTIFFFQAEDGIRDKLVTGVQTCALPISGDPRDRRRPRHRPRDCAGVCRAGLCGRGCCADPQRARRNGGRDWHTRSEEHTSELQSLAYLVCRLLLEKKKKQ